MKKDKNLKDKFDRMLRKNLISYDEYIKIYPEEEVDKDE